MSAPALPRRPGPAARRTGVQGIGAALAGSVLVRVALRLLLIAGLWQIADGFYLHAKAWLAQAMIERAWQENRARNVASARPWRWADTTPVARLDFPRLRATRIVLAGDSGRVLAFGPGHRDGSPLPGRGGNSVVSGHRDTHFALLRELRAEDLIEVETVAGEHLVYRVTGARVVDEHALDVTADRGVDEITLVTCWPFGAVRAGGPLRYVVSGERVASPGPTTTTAAAIMPTQGRRHF